MCLNDFACPDASKANCSLSCIGKKMYALRKRSFWKSFLPLPIVEMDMAHDAFSVRCQDEIYRLPQKLPVRIQTVSIDKRRVFFKRETKHNLLTSCLPDIFARGTDWVSLC